MPNWSLAVRVVFHVGDIKDRRRPGPPQPGCPIPPPAPPNRLGHPRLGTYIVATAGVRGARHRLRVGHGLSRVFNWPRRGTRAQVVRDSNLLYLTMGLVDTATPAICLIMSATRCETLGLASRDLLLWSRPGNWELRIAPDPLTIVVRLSYTRQASSEVARHRFNIYK